MRLTQTNVIKTRNPQRVYLISSPDGTRLLTVSEQPGSVQLYGAPSGALMADLPDLESQPVFSPDSQAFVATTADGNLHIYNREGQHLRQLANPGTYDLWAQGGAFSADSRFFAVPQVGESVFIWNTAGDLVTRLSGHQNYCQCLAFSPDTHWLATVDLWGIVRLWDTSAWQVIGTFLATPHQRGHNIHPRNQRITGIQFSYNGTGMLVTGTDQQGQIQVWDVTSPVQPQWRGALAPPDRNITRVKVATQGALCAYGDKTNAVPDGRAVHVYDTQTGQGVALFPTPNDIPFTIAFSPDAHLLAAQGGAGGVWLWDVLARQEVAAIPSPPSSYDYRANTGDFTAGDVAWMNEGRLLVTSSLERVAESLPDEYVIHFWKVEA